MFQFFHEQDYHVEPCDVAFEHSYVTFQLQLYIKKNFAFLVKFFLANFLIILIVVFRSHVSMACWYLFWFLFGLVWQLLLIIIFVLFCMFFMGFMSLFGIVIGAIVVFGFSKIVWLFVFLNLLWILFIIIIIRKIMARYKSS